MTSDGLVIMNLDHRNLSGGGVGSSSGGLGFAGEGVGVVDSSFFAFFVLDSFFFRSLNRIVTRDGSDERMNEAELVSREVEAHFLDRWFVRTRRHVSTPVTANFSSLSG